MSDTFQTGKTFVTGEQVTANDLNNAVNQAVPKVALTDDQSITVVNNKLTVKDGNATDGVPLTKLKHIIGHSVIGNIGSATAAPTNIEVGANEAVLGNSAGNGLVTDKIDTDNIKDDAVTPAKTSFINPTTAKMTLSGTEPSIEFDDDPDNDGNQNPLITGNSTNGNLAILTKESQSELILECSDNMIFGTTDDPTQDQSGTNDFVERFRVSHDAGKTQAGSNVAGAKVTGGLYVTGDVYADDHVVADHLRLEGDAPNIVFSDSDVGTPNAYITGNGDGAQQKLLMYAPKSRADIAMHSSENFTVKVTDDPTSDYDQSTNPYVERLRVAHDAGKDSGGTDSAGAKVTGDLQVTGDINIGGTINEGISIDADSGTTHEILLGETLTVTGGEGVDTTISNNTLTVSGENATTSNKGIAKFNSANFAVNSGDVTIKDLGVGNAKLAGSIANSKLANSSVTVTAGTGLSGGGSVALGGSTTINLNSAIPNNSTTNTQASTDNSTKLATTAFVKDQLNVGGLGYAILTKSSFATANGSGTNYPITGFTISNNGITVSQSGDNISVPSGVYAITYGMDTCTNPDASGGSAVYNRMGIKRNGTFEVRNEFPGAEGTSRHAGSLSGVYTGGVNFQFTLGQRNTSNSTNRNVTGNNIRVTIVRIA